MKVSKCDQVRSFPQNVFAKETEFVPSSVCNKRVRIEVCWENISILLLSILDVVHLECYKWNLNRGSERGWVLLRRAGGGVHNNFTVTEAASKGAEVF